MISTENTEGLGAKFDLEKYLAAQELIRESVERVASLVTDGMNEDDGRHLVKEEFKKIGVTKSWHPIKFRIGADTLKNFSETGDKDIVIKPGEIFFVDVGPIVEDHESDYGKSFVFKPELALENPYISLAEASRRVWDEVAYAWEREKLTGPQLLKRAESATKKLGYELNPAMGGHRLGDFPHALFSKSKLFQYQQTPSAKLWVLEIHLMRRDLNRGAFFEDIL